MCKNLIPPHDLSSLPFHLFLHLTLSSLLSLQSGAKHTVTQHHYNRYSEDSSVDFVGFVCKVVRETDRSTGTIAAGTIAVHSP